MFMITAGPARIRVFDPPFGFVNQDFEAGGIQYDQDFGADLQSALAAIDLAPGLSWRTEMNSQALILTVVPELGTLAMLAMGTLALTVGWWRRRR